MTELYILIDNNSLIKEVHRTEDCETILSTFLNALCKQIEILSKNNIPLDTISFDDLYILRCNNANGILTVTTKINYDPYNCTLSESASYNGKVSNYNLGVKYPIFNYTCSYLQELCDPSTKNKNKKRVVAKRAPKQNIPKKKQVTNDIDLNDMMVIKEKEPSLKELELQMLELLEKKESKQSELEGIKKTFEEDEKDYVDYKCELDSRRLNKRMKDEKNGERQLIFNSDILTYLNISSEINNNPDKEIIVPPLFKRKYTILKYMDDQDLLDQDDSFDNFIIFYNELYPEKVKNHKKDYIL